MAMFNNANITIRIVGGGDHSEAVKRIFLDEDCHDVTFSRSFDEENSTEEFTLRYWQRGYYERGGERLQCSELAKEAGVTYFVYDAFINNDGSGGNYSEDITFTYKSGHLYSGYHEKDNETVQSDLKIILQISKPEMQLAKQLFDLLQNQFGAGSIRRKKNGFSIDFQFCENDYPANNMTDIMRTVASVFPDREIRASALWRVYDPEGRCVYEACYDPDKEEVSVVFSRRGSSDESKNRICGSGLSEEELQRMISYSEERGFSQLRERLLALHSDPALSEKDSGWKEVDVYSSLKEKFFASFTCIDSADDMMKYIDDLMSVTEVINCEQTFETKK